MAKENDNIACVSFNFEQNLPLPHIPTNDIFYLRQLWLYIFGVHDCGGNIGTMYAWPESVAHRGANEVVSCLDHYFKSLEGIDTLMLFSDSCGGTEQKFYCHALPLLSHSSWTFLTHPTLFSCPWSFVLT